MTAVTRLQLLPAPGTTSGVPAGPAPAPDDQRVKPVLPARAVHSGRPEYRSQSEIEPRGDRACRVTQLARFRPRGLLGLVYWYGVAPLHGLVFRGMLRGIRRHALRAHRASGAA